MKAIVGVMVIGLFACSAPTETVGHEESRQVEPGTYRLKQGPTGSEFEVGWMSVATQSGPHGTSTETWYTYQTGQQFSSGYGPYGPPSSAISSQHTRFLYTSGGPQYQVDTFVVQCTVPASGGTTGSGATITVPYLFEPGIYDLQQSGSKVGVLVVEPRANNIIWQHWVLWTEYVWPSSGSTNVNTKYVRTGSYTATDIQALIDAHESVYIKGEQTYGG